MYETLLHRLQHGFSKHSLELTYVSQKRWPIPQETISKDHLKVLVLDASFNPPTLAHLALANSLPPSAHSATRSADDSAQSDIPDYDAKLLLLSVRNADKTLQRGDASYSQRLHMMQLFAQGIKSQKSQIRAYCSEEDSNVAIGIINEPTFVGKSKALLAFLKSRFGEISEHAPIPNLQLNFVLGFDTLERIFQPRYYGSREQMRTSLREFLSPPPEGQDSRIICAQRSPSSYKAQISSESDGSFAAQEWFSSQRIMKIDIGEDLSSYSSSEVRRTIQRLGLESQEWRKFVPSQVAEYIVHERLFVDGAVD